MPVPFEITLSAVVGVADSDQQIPLSVTVSPPSSVTLPPEVAEYEVIEVMLFVETEARASALVVKVISPPYDVPTLFVAYALA